jgi:hypothetical protein
MKPISLDVIEPEKSLPVFAGLDDDRRAHRSRDVHDFRGNASLIQPTTFSS